MPETPFSLVVLISGNGSNLQAIIDAISQDRLPARICAVISNRSDAYGLSRAEQAGIPTKVIDHTQFPSRESFDQSLMQAIDEYAPDLVVLAGFMRILTDDFVQHYLGKMINIHPSLLPRYQGLNTHQRVLDARETTHGASVHYVIPELDSGPVILQSIVAVKPDDTAETLQQRVHAAEHRLYPEAIRRIATGSISWHADTVLHNGQPLDEKDIIY